ncbi:MAG: hypothetical protein HDQ87_03555 [Clostridia bacterium]|nr:hypothetical protein [Clostridia bacterium]
MSDQNKDLSQAEQKLEKAAAELEDSAAALRADQFVEAVVDAAVPDLAPDAPASQIGSAPPAAAAGTLDEELSALKDNAARTRQDQRIMEAEADD